MNVGNILTSAEQNKAIFFKTTNSGFNLSWKSIYKNF